MEVVGEGVDSYDLIKCLKKKFKCATILSIQEVKPPVKPPSPPPSPPHCRCDPCGGVQYYPICQPVYDYNPPSCSLMQSYISPKFNFIHNLSCWITSLVYWLYLFSFVYMHKNFLLFLFSFLFNKSHSDLSSRFINDQRF